MLGIESEKWFSLFKRGVELLAEMSTFQFSAGEAAFENRKTFAKKLQSGNVKGKISHSRSVLIKKAKAASFKGHGVPQQLGKASHSNWARRPTAFGHGAPQPLGMATHRKWAGRPTEEGQGILASILQFGKHIVRILFPHRCEKPLQVQAKAAADWIAEARE